MSKYVRFEGGPYHGKVFCVSLNSSGIPPKFYHCLEPMASTGATIDFHAIAEADQRVEVYARQLRRNNGSLLDRYYYRHVPATDPPEQADLPDISG